METRKLSVLLPTVAYCLSIYYLSLSVCSVCLSVCIFTERVSFLSYLILSYPPPHTPQAIRLPDGVETRGYIKEINDVDIGDLLYYHLQSVRVAHDEMDEYVFEILRKVVVSLVYCHFSRRSLSAVLRQIESVSLADSSVSQFSQLA